MIASGRYWSGDLVMDVTDSQRAEDKGVGYLTAIDHLATVLPGKVMVLTVLGVLQMLQLVDWVCPRRWKN